MALKKAKILKWWGKVFILALLLVWLIRAFVVQSYTVSSAQMETALLDGDKVLVNKLSYGLRLPSTLLSIPFTFDRFLGIKSYSDLIQLDYFRWFSSDVSRNDVVLFNNPMETEKPFDKRSLCLSRCVAVAGDTIIVKGADFYINGKKYVSSPDLLLPFRFDVNHKDSILTILKDLKIEPRNQSSDSLWAYSTQSRYEAFLINQRLTDSLQLELNIDENRFYGLMIPKRGMKVKLTEENRMLYASIIKAEIAGYSKIEDIKEHTFKYNYYWFLSDNPNDGIDSRTLGFISEVSIVGKAALIWCGSNKNDLHENRSMTWVK